MNLKVKKKIKIFRSKNYIKIAITICTLLYFLLAFILFNMNVQKYSFNEVYNYRFFVYVPRYMAILLIILASIVFIFTILRKRIFTTIMSFLIVVSLIIFAIWGENVYAENNSDRFQPVTIGWLGCLVAIIIVFLITMLTRSNVKVYVKVCLNEYVREIKKGNISIDEYDELVNCCNGKDLIGIYSALSQYTNNNIKTNNKNDELIDESNPESSRFVGTAFSYFIHMVFWKFLMVITLRIIYPFVIAMQEKYLSIRTYTSGKKNDFDGHGVQLIGRYVLWLFLSIITFGIYYIVLSARVIKWKVSHTHFVESEEKESVYNGSGVVRFFMNLGLNLLVLITLTLAYPFKIVTLQRYDTSHTIIDGYKVRFTGNAMQYIGKHITWLLLAIITFGIFYIFVPLRKQKWIKSHIVIVQKEE